MSNEDLLRPTLSGFTRVPALYHSTGFFLSAFFGGPVGAGIYALANTLRLGRLRQDGPIVVLIAAVAVVIALELARLEGLPALSGYLGTGPHRSGEILLRALGILSFGAIYLRQRRFFRAAQVAGIKPLPGWIPGAIAIAAGLLANFTLIEWFLIHH